MNTRIAATGRPFRISPRHFCILALLPALLLVAAPGSASLFWVGNNGNPPCTHASLQAAIDTAVGGAGFDVIYLVGPGPFTGPFIVLGNELEIHGNVGSCGSGVSVGQATLQAASGSRPLTILSGAAGTVRLRHLMVTTNNGSYDGDGGGIWFTGASPSSRLELIDTRVNANTAFGDGGGILVSQGKLVLSTGAQVGLNAANRGGGIAALNGAVVEMRGSSVLVNTALLDGGGIFAPDAQVLIENPSPQTTTFVGSNIAGRDGGGLYLGGGYDDLLSGLVTAPLVIGSNLAQRGGGLFVDGTQVRVDYVRLSSNVAGGEGGGAYVTGTEDSGGLVSVAFGQPTLGGYPRVETNTAADGAAIFVAGEGQVGLSSGRIRDHHPGAGTALVVATESSGILLQGVVVESNTAPALFAAEDAAELAIVHGTIVNNSAGGIVRWSGSNSLVTVISTVLDETEPFFAAFENPSTPPLFACVLSHYGSPFVTVPPGTDLSFVTYADPQLVAPPADVHLRHTSPAIDLCLSTASNDSDGDLRNHDDPYHPNALGSTGDAGADEATVLFADGFESGGLGQWNGGHSP